MPSHCQICNKFFFPQFAMLINNSVKQVGFRVYVHDLDFLPTKEKAITSFLNFNYCKL
jgi:hypothetical protein